ncbi:hypothetical protein, partial [Enterobacter hormaechei]
DRNRSHWSTSKTPSYTKSVSWQHHRFIHHIQERYMRKFKYIICHQCEGHGTMENPAFENGFTQSEMAEWEPEMREKYFAGAFDVRCDVCAGDGKLSVPNVAAMSFSERRVLAARRRDERLQAADERLSRQERAMGY